MPALKKSLEGKHIVITRGIQAGKAWGDYLKKRGVIVHQFPTIAVSLARPTKKLAGIFAHLDAFSWIVFTSAAGPYAMRELMKKMRVMTKPGAMPRIAAIGKNTANAVRGIGYRVAFIPKKATGRALARGLKLLRSPILLLRTDIATDELPKAFMARGAEVVNVSIYTTKILDKKAGRPFLKMLSGRKIDHLTFASPSSVRGFSLRLGKDDMALAREIPTIALGPTVARALRDLRFKKIKTSRSATVEGVADAILES